VVTSFTPAPAGNGRAIAYDGTDLYYTYFGSNLIYRVATDGTAIDSYDTGVQLGALSWDSSRGKLWAGSYDGLGNVYLVDYGVSVVPQFNFISPTAHFPGFIDGLAWDSSDDTLWLSDDWDHNVYHYTTAGGYISDWVIDLGDGQPVDNSGLEVCGDWLFLGHPADAAHGPAANMIWAFMKDGTYTGWSINAIGLQEGLAMGNDVLWANNAVTNLIVAYDITGSPCAPIEVDCDIKPGSDPNSINLKSKGVIPVAVLGSATFDVTTINVTTLMFEGASPVHWAYEDVNQDSFTDLVSHYRTQETNLTSGSTSGTISGQLTNGLFFECADSVRIVGG
jgi:hypothetical protein